MTSFRAAGISDSDDSDDDFDSPSPPKKKLRSCEPSFFTPDPESEFNMANRPMTSVRRHGIGRGFLRQDIRDSDDAGIQNSTHRPAANIGHGYSRAGQPSMGDTQAEGTSPLTNGVAINAQFDTGKFPQAQDDLERKMTIKSMRHEPERNNPTSDSQTVAISLGRNIPDSRNVFPTAMTDYLVIHSLSKCEQMEFIPHINPIMAGISFSSIRSAWNSNKSISQECKNAYATCNNSFCLGLFLMMRSYDFAHSYKPEKNLCCEVICELKTYLSGTTSWESQLTKDIQKLAFHLVLTYKKMDLKDLIVEIFKLKDIQDELLEEIKVLSRGGLFKQALWGSLALELFSFDIHDFLMPMILQDRFNYVEEYFNHKGARQLLLNLIEFIDQIASNRNIGNWWSIYARKYKIDPATIVQTKLTARTLTKLVKRFANKYNIAPAAFPNITKNQRLAELRHLFYKKFTEANSDMSDENFQEVVATLVNDDFDLTKEAMHLMKVHAGVEFGVGFAKTHNIPEDWLPSDVQRWLKSGLTSQMTSQVVDEDWEVEASSSTQTIFCSPTQHINSSLTAEPSNDDENKHTVDTTSTSNASNLNYSIPSQIHITLVSCLDDFNLFMDHIKQELGSKNPVLVGVDSEWQPCRSTTAALLQLAFQSQIFLIDLFTLSTTIQANSSPNPFETMLSDFFACEKIIKLGYDINNDFKMLCPVSEYWTNLKSMSKGILDLKTLQTDILRRRSNFFPFSNARSSDRGLSELVQMCLAKTLNKGEQLSNWERRPLRQSQITYAATDAYCLLQIFNVITEGDKVTPIGLDDFIKATQTQTLDAQKCRKLRVPIEIIHSVFFNKTENGSRAWPTGSNESTESSATRTVETVEIVCDTMLEGLGKLLRSFGLKTFIKERNNSVDALCPSRLAKSTGRLVITRGKNQYNDLLSVLSPDQVTYVNSNVYTDQIIEVLDYFKIVVYPSDCHRICFCCNNNVFIKASKEFIDKLVERRGYKKSKMLTEDALSVVVHRPPPEMIICIDDTQRRWCLRTEKDIVIQLSENKMTTIAFTPSGIQIETKRIPIHLLDSYIDEFFYICDSCGVCYWSSKRIEKMMLNDKSQTQIQPSLVRND